MWTLRHSENNRRIEHLLVHVKKRKNTAFKAEQQRRAHTPAISSAQSPLLRSQYMHLGVKHRAKQEQKANSKKLFFPSTYVPTTYSSGRDVPF